ncbi:MAG: hypothetical protein A2V88_09620 [Elusimicrobia bacterium RBG_16_66_12]|nr:MAG: hypothetical protein A2V88_09620 [Elusimicrobia bacterium RBG_16_66_12]
MPVNIPLSLLAATLAAAQTADKGYVVRVDSDTVWLDLTAADGSAAGRAFDVYAEGAELKHPVTGAALGRIQQVVASGSIRDIAEKFSTGWITVRTGTPVKAGQRARFLAPAPAPAEAAKASRSGEPQTRAPKTQGASLPYAATGMAVGDFDGAGKPQMALSSENAVHLYAYPAADGKTLAQTILPGTGLRILGLEAANLDGDKRDELFVSVYDESFRRFETRVLKVEAGKWLKVAELPFLVRGYQDAKGARVTATQQVQDDKTFPLGTIYPLAYKDGKYAQGAPAFRHRRVDWIYGFTTAQIGDGEPAVLFLTSVHNLRVQFGKEYWRSPDDDYGQTPIRVRWNDKLLEFNPPMALTYGEKGLDALYAVRNMAALGGLASPFGLFNKGELQSKRWNGLAFETAWKADLSGCAQGLSIVETQGRKEIAVAVIGAAGRSSVWTFEP